MHKSLGAASTALALVLGAPAMAEGIFLNTLTKNYELHDIDPDYWEKMGYRARDIVSSGEHIGARVTESGHHLLGLDSASPQARAIYLATAGFVNLRFQQANAIMFGHEYMHFALADLMGRQDHYFRTEDGDELDFSEAYFNTLIWGGPGAPATSSGSRNGFAPDKTIMKTAIGVDWQMQYSERWVQRALLDGQSFFALPGYIANRTKLTTYAFSDSVVERDGVQGDITKVADRYTALGHDTDAGDIALWGLVGTALSPTTWQAYLSSRDYIEFGALDMRDPFFNLDNGLRFTWDVPQYLNAEAMTLAPMLYADTGHGIVGIGSEFAVIGDANSEVNLAYLQDFGKTDVGVNLTWADTGTHIEVEAGYELLSAVSLEARFAATAGETLRGFRNNPAGGEVLYGGVSFRF